MSEENSMQFVEFPKIARLSRECVITDGRHWFCDEWQLRKRPQKGIPQSVLAIFGHKVPA